MNALAAVRRTLLFSLCIWGLTLTTKSLSGQVEVEMFISLVNVWVKALDSSGNPVTDLKAEDFEVYEDGQRMTLDCFEQRTTDLTKKPVETVDAPKFVVFLDLLNTEPKDLLMIRPQLNEFLDRMAPASYEVMVFVLLPNGKLGVVSPYTRNIFQVKAAVEKAKGNALLSGEVRNNESQIRSLLDRLEPEPEPVMSIEDLAQTIRDPVQERNTQRLKSAYDLAAEYTKQEKARGELALQALESMGVYLAKKNEEGHSVVLYISGGFSSDPGRHYFDLIEHVAERKGFIFDRQVFAMRVGKQEPDRYDVNQMVRKTLGKLNRLNVTLYSVGTAGMATLADASRSGNVDSNTSSLAGQTALQDSLHRVANETGGLAFANSQNFKVGFDRIMVDLEHNYLLCYAPPQHKTPQYREIKVVCKKPGVTIRHRKGYFD